MTKGSKPFTFEWLKDSLLLTNDRLRILNDEDYSILKVNLINANDAGNYTCKASNSFGADAYVSQVFVKHTPQWTIEPNDTSVRNGDHMRMECNASGSPIPTISWFKLAKPYRFVTSGSTLELFNIQHTSAGLYECVADNGIDKTLKKVFRITIKGMVCG